MGEKKLGPLFRKVFVFKMSRAVRIARFESVSESQPHRATHGHQGQKYSWSGAAKDAGSCTTSSSKERCLHLELNPPIPSMHSWLLVVASYLEKPRA